MLFVNLWRPSDPARQVRLGIKNGSSNEQRFSEE